MTDVAKMFESTELPIMASDPDFNIIYSNAKCSEIFRKSMKIEELVGLNMRACHNPETMEKLEKLYAEYRTRSRNMDYYTTDGPNGKLTIVNVPFYEEETFLGVVEFIFPGSLA